MDKNLLFQFLQILPENPSESEIEKGYKALAQIFHPDRNPSRKEWAEEKMKQLNEARDILSNPAKRSEYIHIYKNSQAHQNTQSIHLKRLQNENQQLRTNLFSSNQTNGILGLTLLLLGATMLSDS